MMKPLAALALALFLPGSALAQACGTTDLTETLSADERAALDALVAPHPFPEGNLWRAAKDGSEVIVVGTIHIPDPRLAPIVETIEPHLRDAELLILEVTSDEQSTIANLAAERPEMFFLTDGPSLIDLLGEDDWALVEDRMAELGMPAFIGAKFQPWYRTLTLSMPPCAMAAMAGGAVGLDRQLEEIAVAAGVPLASLDDVDEFMGFFTSGTLEEQLDALRLTVATQADTEATSSTLVEAYFDGRIREGWEFSRILVDRMEIEGGQEMFEEMEAMLLDGRNASWEEQLPGLVEGRDVVIAVGAAHLSGETGVLRALERAGYAVDPLGD